MIDVGILSAFFGGLLTFLAPCTLPLVPAYLGFIGGVGSVRQEGLSPTPQRLFLALHALLFVLGFSVVFISYGLLSGALGALFVTHKATLARAGGIIIILFGLSLLDVFPAGRFFSGIARPLPVWIRPGTSGGSFLLGFLFALGWSPCLGPILGSILVLASTTGHVFWGAFLLAVYSLGLGVPFLLLALLYGSSYAYISPLTRFVPIVATIGALVLVVLGVLLLLGDLGYVGEYMGRVISFLNYDRLTNYM